MSGGVEGGCVKSLHGGIVTPENVGLRNSKVELQGKLRKSEILKRGVAPGALESVPAAQMGRFSSQDYKEVKTLMTGMEHNFGKARDDNQMVEFEKSKLKRKRANKIEREADIKIMQVLEGFINVNMCRSKKWIPILKQELTARSVEMSGSEGIKQLRVMLLSDEHKTNNNLPEERKKWFKPMSRSAQEWVLEEVDMVS